MSPRKVTRPAFPAIALELTNHPACRDFQGHQPKPKRTQYLQHRTTTTHHLSTSFHLHSRQSTTTPSTHPTHINPSPQQVTQTTVKVAATTSTMSSRSIQTQQGAPSRKADSSLKVRPQQPKPSGTVNEQATSTQTRSSTGSTSKTLTAAVDNTSATTRIPKKKIESNSYDPDAFQQWLKEKSAEAAAMQAEDEARKKAIAARRKQEAAEKKLESQARAAKFKAADRASIFASPARQARKKNKQPTSATTQRVQAQPKRLQKPSPKPVKRPESPKSKKKSKQPVKDETANKAVAQMTTESDIPSELELPSAPATAGTHTVENAEDEAPRWTSSPETTAEIESAIDSNESPSTAHDAEVAEDNACTNKESAENALREELDSTVQQLSESQKEKLWELVGHHCDDYSNPADHEQEVDIYDLPLEPLNLLAVWIRAQISNNTESDNSAPAQSATETAREEPEINTPSVEANQVDTSPTAPSNVLNENGKRPLDDAESASQDSHAQESKRARRSESPKVPGKEDADDISASGVITAVNEPITASGAVIDEATSDPIIKGELEETPKPRKFEPIEQETEPKVSKRKSMDDDHMSQTHSQPPAKKPKLSHEEEAMRKEASQATAEPQAEAKVLTQDNDVEQPGNTSQGAPPVVDTQTAATEKAADNADATNGDESKTNEDSKTKAQQTSAQNGNKSKEEASSMPVPSNSSNIKNNNQQKPAHSDENEVTDPIVPKKPAEVAHNSNNSNVNVKTKISTKKSVSETKATSTTQNSTTAMNKDSATMSKTHNTTASKTSSTKNTPSALAAKKTTSKPPSDRFQLTNKEERQRRAEQKTNLQPTTQKAQAVAKTTKKPLADKTNIKRQQPPQHGRDSAKPAVEKARESQPKKQTGSTNKEASVPTTKKHFKTAEEMKPASHGKRCRDEEDEGEDDEVEVEKPTKPAKKRRNISPSPELNSSVVPNPTRASRRKTASKETAATAQLASVKKTPANRDLKDITLGLDEEEDEDVQPKKKAKTVREQVDLKGDEASETGKDGAEDEKANRQEDGEATSSPAPDTTGTQPHDDNAPASPVRAPATQPERKKGVAYPRKQRSQTRKPAPKKDKDVRRFLFD